MAGSKCDVCSNYEYDEYYEYYTCVVGLDEDEMAKFMQNSFGDCPYFQFDDEYVLASKQ